MATVNSVYTLRFDTTFKSVSKRIWWVGIYDRTSFQYNGSFDITDGGLEIQYDCEGDEKYAPIVGSKLNLNFMLDLDDIAHQEFIDDILGYTSKVYIEGDIFILVRVSNGSGAIIFDGEYLMDLDTLPDVASPFPIQLTFTDGIGKLKEIAFESATNDATATEYHLLGHQQFNWWIGEVIQHTKFYKNPANPDGFWDDRDSKSAFQTCCRWYNSEHYYSPTSTSKWSDVLQMTSAKMNWARKYNPSNGQINIANAYDVLKAICKSWGMRVIKWNGIFYFYQIKELDIPNEYPGTFDQKWTGVLDEHMYRYRASGNPTSQYNSMGFRRWDRHANYMYNVSHPGARTQKLEGGSYKFLPVLKEVKVNLVHEGFQNVFGGIPVGNAYNTNGMPFISGPFLNSAQFKFETTLYIDVEGPGGPNCTFFDLFQVPLRIIAMPPGATTIGQGLATLTYDPVANTYGWDDTPTYVGLDLGVIINHTSMGGPYAGSGLHTIPLAPQLSFPGYRDASTDYWITNSSPIYATNQWGTWINIQTGNPYGSGYIFPTWSNPLNSGALNPPSWSTGSFNNYLSVIQPVATTQATMNTIFINTQTDDSHKIDWGDVFWGDGPEFWDDSALRIRTGASTWEFSDWTSSDWLPRNYTQGLPPSGSGHEFTALLCYAMKRSQSQVIRRANFKLADSPVGTSYLGFEIQVNPVGNIQDIYQDAYGTPETTRYFFRRGSFNMITNEWDGEWIESTEVELGGGNNNSSKIAGGTNLVGRGTELSAAIGSAAAPHDSRARLMLLIVSEEVVADVAITTLEIETNRSEEIDPETQFKIGDDYNLKDGDEVWLCFKDGYKMKLTLTADVTTESTTISFSSVTPTASSNGFSSIQIPMLKLFENMNRKTSGQIAGFDVDATSLTKGSVSIDGFIDSDSMSGATNSKLSTSESIKAYVDAQVHDGEVMPDFSMQQCSGTATTSATNGVVGPVPFDTKGEQGTASTLEQYGAAGVPEVTDSAYCWTIGDGETWDGIYQFNWNVATDVSTYTTRILVGVKLQQGVVYDPGEGELIMDWGDVNGSVSYVYDRGTGSIIGGSTSGSVLISFSGAAQLYYRLVFWKVSASAATATATTQTDGCQLTIKKLED
tara:strand:+ start:4608 stop:7970 length:3363 start_codon:yes stop_codon:yes gene_type:complete